MSSSRLSAMTGKSVVSRLKTTSAKGQGDASGAVNEDIFEQAFENVPTLSIYSAKDINDRLTKIRDTMSNAACDWEKRIDSLKEVRSLLLSEAVDFSEIVPQLRCLDAGLSVSVKDLRSQVVREACITIAYLSKRLELKFDFSAETLLPALITLLQNSAKVMATSASVAITFIIQYTHSPRLIPIINNNLTSKSTAIRSYCCQFLYQMLSVWSKSCLERQIASLQESIKRGLGDADSETRNHAKRAFASFADHFPEQAATLLATFDPTRQRQLLSELSDPSAVEAAMTRGNSAVNRRPSSDRSNTLGRSTSSSRRRPSLDEAETPIGPAPVAQRSRPRVSMSQPGSRSNSPPSHAPKVASRPSMAPPDVTAVPRPSSSLGMRIRGPPSGTHRVAHSQGNSRDTSPDRTADGPRFGFGIGRRPSDFEAAVADRLRQQTNRRRQRLDDSDAASETSSVCSETSFRSYPDISEDVSEVLTLCSSGSWAERREGLVLLQRLLRMQRRLSPTELKRITETFTRMFHDPHSKVFSVFIDAFVDLVTVHGCDLVDWFALCFSRLVGKAGTDVLSALHTRITRALDAMRNSFPHDYQFTCVMRYVVEQTHLPTVKVKLTLLSYTQALVCVMGSDIVVNNSDTRLAVSRFITWATDPKSAEVRKAANGVLIALYQLNSTQLLSMLAVLPKNFQDSASKILSGIQPQSPRPRAVQLGGIQSTLPRPSYSSTPQKPSSANRYNRAEVYSDVSDGLVADNIFNDIRQATADIEHLSLLGRQLDLPRGNGVELEWLNRDDEATGSNEEIIVTDETLSTIISELSNYIERPQSMLRLLALVPKEAAPGVWDQHFKTLLQVLLDLMKDDDGKVRTLSLKILKEFLRFQSERFVPYVALTVLRLLEFEKDSDKEVQRAAEDCSSVLASVMDPLACIGVLNPISDTAEFPVNLAAIKMQEKVIRAADLASTHDFLPLVLPTLKKSFEGSDSSSVRKSSMLCLVYLHEKIGDELLPHLADLNPSKMKLLNLYIRRSQEQRESAVGTPNTGLSEPNSPASPPSHFGGFR